MANPLVTAAFLAAALAVAGCTHSTPEKPGAIQAVSAKTFVRKWSVDTHSGDGPVKQMYVRDDLLFAYTSNGTSYVISRESGQLLYVHPLPGGYAYIHPPVVMKEFIVYPTLTTLEIYGRKNGQLVRSQKLPFAVRSNAVGSKSALFLGADYPQGGRLVALDLGQQYVPMHWELMFPNASVSAGPAFYNETVFSAAEDGSVTAVSADSREPSWSLTKGFFVADGPIVADLRADDFGVYVGTTEGRLYCLGRGNGKVKWQYYASAGIREPVQVTKTVVYLHVPDGGLVAIDKSEGPDKSKPQYNRQARWTFDRGQQFLAEDETLVTVRSEDSTVVALDKKDGTPQFSSKRKDIIAAASNIKDAGVYIATARGRIMGIQPVTKTGLVGELVLDDRDQDTAADQLALADGAHGH